jgi:hypothetical protein
MKAAQRQLNATQVGKISTGQLKRLNASSMQQKKAKAERSARAAYRRLDAVQVSECSSMQHNVSEGGSTQHK